MAIALIKTLKKPTKPNKIPTTNPIKPSILDGGTPRGGAPWQRTKLRIFEAKSRRSKNSSRLAPTWRPVVALPPVNAAWNHNGMVGSMDILFGKGRIALIIMDS